VVLAKNHDKSIQEMLKYCFKMLVSIALTVVRRSHLADFFFVLSILTKSELSIFLSQHRKFTKRSSDGGQM